MTEKIPDAIVRTTQYQISCLPDDHVERRHWTLYLEWRSADRWAITTGFRDCYSKAGEWDYEMLPSEREDVWLDQHRFTLYEALELGKKLASKMVINNIDVAGAMKNYTDNPDWRT